MKLVKKFSISLGLWEKYDNRCRRKPLKSTGQTRKTEKKTKVHGVELLEENQSREQKLGRNSVRDRKGRELFYKSPKKT